MSLRRNDRSQNYRRKLFSQLHYRGESRHGRIRLALPDGRGKTFTTKQSDHDGRPHDYGEKSHVAFDRSQEWLLSYLDAKSGKLLYAKPLVKTTWASATSFSQPNQF